MGALVQAGTVDDTIIPTGPGTVNNASTGTTPRILGVAIVDEVMARENESSGTAQEHYVDEDPVVYETLVNGDVLNLLTAATNSAGDNDKIKAGARMTFGTDGMVFAALTVQPGTVNVIGTALDTPGLTANQQGKYPVPVLIQLEGPKRVP